MSAEAQDYLEITCLVGQGEQKCLTRQPCWKRKCLWFTSSRTCIGCLPAVPPSWSSADPHPADGVPHSLPGEDCASTWGHFPTGGCKCDHSRSLAGSLPEHWCCHSAQSQWSESCMQQTRRYHCGRLTKNWKAENIRSAILQLFKAKYRPSWTCRQVVAAGHAEWGSGCWCRWPPPACGHPPPPPVSRCLWTKKPGRHRLGSEHQSAGRDGQSPVWQSDELLGRKNRGNNRFKFDIVFFLRLLNDILTVYIPEWTQVITQLQCIVLTRIYSNWF